MAPTAPHAYLDFNATAPLLPDVAAAMTVALGTFGNPSSVHAVGRRASAAIEDAREAIATAVGSRAERVVFTSGATEANALALTGVGAPPDRVWASAIEHPSVLSHVPPARRLPVLASGVIDLAAAKIVIDRLDPPFLVSLMLVNNETGVIQPVAELAAMVKARGGRIHCDAVQALGRLPLDLASLHADAITISAHKIGGPKGAGAVVLAADVDIAPLISGGGQERGRRAGTENSLGIVGFGVAVGAVPRLIADQSRVRELRDGLERWIAAAAPSAVIHGQSAPRVANTVSVSAPGHGSDIQIISLDLAGVAVSAGAACSSGRVADSHVLTAMGLSADVVRSAIRISLGHASTAADIDAFKRAWAPAKAAQAA
ncbi:MAG: cysteine desulfurase [Alphaproteobacteria bacterium]|nr:cysteine desulfurase [Alphaproteobacteria bacterium]